MLLRLVIILSFVFLAAFLIKAGGGANLLFLLPPPPDKNDDEGFAEEEEEDKEAQQESRDLILCRVLAKKNTGEEDKDEDIIFCTLDTTNAFSFFNDVFVV